MVDTVLVQSSCHLCDTEDFTLLEKVTKKPELETDYGISDDDYYREICQCNNCQVFFNKHEELINDDFYKGHYNAAIKFGSIKKRYEKIIGFSIEKSDNKQRAWRVQDFLELKGHKNKSGKILDVGSGTCVFLHEMKAFGHKTYCVDPDPVSVKHALENVHVDGAHEGTLENYNTDISFDLITFNKVLEHIKKPAVVLEQAKNLLSKDGFIYVELPDGTEIFEAKNMVNRSEFFLEHYLTFNEPSFKKLVELAGLELVDLQRIHDPSGKHTIYGFLKNK